MKQKKRHLSLRYKILIPILLILALILAINFISKRNTLEEKMNDFATFKTEEISEIITAQINSTSEKALMSASVCSNLDFVYQAYIAYYKTNDLDSASAIIEDNINEINNDLEKATGIKSKIHFLLPPARSFIRCWTDKRGDDLSLYRNTISQINNNHSPIKGIEIGREGFAIRGLYPIFINNKYNGAVEVLLPFNSILSDVIETYKHQNYALYINNDQIKIATQLEKQITNLKAYKNKSTEHSLVMKSNNFIVDEAIVKSETTQIIGDFAYLSVSITDYKNNEIGYYVVQYDISKEIATTDETIKKFATLASMILIVVSILFILFINKIIISPIVTLTDDIQIISKGKIIDNLIVKGRDEISVIFVAFNRLLNRTRELTLFTQKIGRGEYDADIKDTEEDDELSKSLLIMRDNLIQAKVDDDKRKIEDEKRNWASQGLAKFGEILRTNDNDIQRLSDEILKNLVHYIGATQGSIFMINDTDTENVFLDLIASYAYNRKKHSEKQIKIGEGLVGACAIEKLPIYMTNVPDDYVTITSGLGEANPNNIFLIPLKLEENIFGVIELASLDIFEPYKQDFIEKLCESIASSLNSVKINIRTAELLEKSQQQAEELFSQEEEMRQNIEEMQATQEETSRKEQEYQSILNVFSASYAYIEFDMNKKVLSTNSLFSDLFIYNLNEIKNEDITSLLGNGNVEKINKLWDQIMTGEKIKETFMLKTITREIKTVVVSFTPIYDNDNVKITKVFAILEEK